MTKIIPVKNSIATDVEKEHYLRLLALEKSIDDMTNVEGFSWETPGNNEKFRSIQRNIYAFKNKILQMFTDSKSDDIFAWCKRLKLQINFEALYPKCICSACPFSQGIAILLKEKRVPCSMFYKGLHIDPLYECGHVRDKKMTIQQLCHLIVSRGRADNNDDYLYFFLKKRKELEPYTYPKNINEVILGNLEEFI